MEHQVIITHPFDVLAGEPATLHTTREIFARTAAYKNWCEKHATGRYYIHNAFYVKGIIVDFEHQEDAAKFQVYAAAFWIYLCE